MEPIRLEFSLDAKEIAEGLSLHPVHRPLKWIFPLTACGALISLTYLGLLAYSKEATDLGTFFHSHIDVFEWLFIAVFFSSLGYFQHRFFAKHPFIGRPLSYEISAANFQGASALGDSKLNWKAFTFWNEGENVYAVVAEQTCFILPKRVMSDDIQENLRTLLIQEIGPKGKSRKPLSKR